MQEAAPQAAKETTRRVRQDSTVHGLVTYSDGVPVAGVPVEILTAPANGTNSFALAATRTADASGQWTASLPPGPSRIVEAAYGGSATTYRRLGRRRSSSRLG